MHLIDKVWDKVREHQEENSSGPITLKVNEDNFTLMKAEFETLFEIDPSVNDLENYFGFSLIVDSELQKEYELS